MSVGSHHDGAPLRVTPLHALHVGLGARMVPFAGYEMPVQYAAGVLKEHLATRSGAGLFDVSHMGQIEVRAKSGRIEDAAKSIEALVPSDVIGLAPGRQRYSFLTTPEGGILDDLMIANLGSHLLLVVNAARKEADLAHLRAHLSNMCTLDMVDRALIALQGPKAEAAISRLAPGAERLAFMDIAGFDVLGATATIVRSGYTGEDGFEISIPASRACETAERLLAEPDVVPVGLGARDSLRLEAGLCLYGADIDEATSPVEAQIDWAIAKVRRKGGARAGGFPGAARILGEIERGASRRRVGLRAEGRAPVRAGAPLFLGESGGEPIGKVTSGGFGPSLDAPVAMGYLPAPLAQPGTRIFADVRGKRLGMMVAALPFVAPRYRRARAS